jgi:aldehyde dehydrogenase (NAD+)
MTTKRRELFIDGRLVPAHGTNSLDVTDPATETVIGSIAEADEGDVERAVAAARAALPAWRALPVPERARFLIALADAYQRRGEEIARLVTLESGSVITQTRPSTVFAPPAVYRFHSQLGETLELESVVEGGGKRAIMRREPFGVVGAIVPFNSPQGILSLQVAPALLAGCTVVAKPSPETTLDAYLFTEALTEAGLPPGVVNIVTGGAPTGSALVASPGTDKIAFTGSTAAGRTIAAACGQMLKSVTAELGGKSAAILLDDADLEQFAAQVIPICLPNTGQVCVSCTRVLVPRHRFAEVLDAVVETLAKARLGEPMDPDSEFGPLVSARQRDRVEGYIRSGRDEGARVVLGGGRPDRFPVGYYVEPTVFTDVTSSMRIFQEEIFGPVLCVVPYDGDDDAVALANDSSYGLSGAIFTRDEARAVELARRLDTGGVLVNGQRNVMGHRGWAFKNSGTDGGRELSAYLQLKSISVTP